MPTTREEFFKLLKKISVQIDQVGPTSVVVKSPSVSIDVAGLASLLREIENNTDGIEALLTSIDGNTDGIESLLTTTNSLLTTIDTVLDSISTELDLQRNRTISISLKALVTDITGGNTVEWRIVTPNGQSFEYSGINLDPIVGSKNWAVEMTGSTTNRNYANLQNTTVTAGTQHNLPQNGSGLASYNGRVILVADNNMLRVIVSAVVVNDDFRLHIFGKARTTTVATITIPDVGTVITHTTEVNEVL